MSTVQLISVNVISLDCVNSKIDHHKSLTFELILDLVFPIISINYIDEYIYFLISTF